MLLEQRTADRLHWTLDRPPARGRMVPAAVRGLCVDGPDAPTVMVTVEAVARSVASTISADVSAEH
jgi:hypothetical protein